MKKVLFLIFAVLYLCSPCYGKDVRDKPHNVLFPTIFNDDLTVQSSATVTFSGNKLRDIGDGTAPGEAVAVGQGLNDADQQYTNSATGGETDSQQNWMERKDVNVLDFIIPSLHADILSRIDTGTDHSTAIMAAYDAATLKGVDMVMPLGTYNVAGATQLSFLDDGTKVKGSGFSNETRGIEGCTVIQWTGLVGGNVIEHAGYNNGVSGIHIDCGLPESPKADRGLYHVGEYRNCTFNISIKGGTTASNMPDSVDWTDNNSRNKFENVVITQMFEDADIDQSDSEVRIIQSVSGRDITLDNVAGLSIDDLIIIDANEQGSNHYSGTAGNNYTDAKIFQIEEINSLVVTVFENFFSDRTSGTPASLSNPRKTKYPGDDIVTTLSTVKLCKAGVSFIPTGHHSEYYNIHLTNQLSHNMVLGQGDQNTFFDVTVQTPFVAQPLDIENEGTHLDSNVVSAVTTSISITDSSFFPDLADSSTGFTTTKHFFIWFTENSESEVMKVTDISGTGPYTFTVERAIQDFKTHVNDNSVASSAFAFTTAATLTPVLGWNFDPAKQPYKTENYIALGNGTNSKAAEFMATPGLTDIEGENGSIIHVLTGGQTGGLWHIGSSTNGPTVRVTHLDHQDFERYVQVDDTEIDGYPLNTEAELLNRSLQHYQDEFGSTMRPIGTEAVIGEDIPISTSPAMFGKSQRFSPLAAMSFAPPAWWASFMTNTGESLRVINSTEDGVLQVFSKAQNNDSNYPTIDWDLTIDEETRAIDFTGKYRTDYETYETPLEYDLKVNGNPVLMIDEPVHKPLRLLVTSGGVDTLTSQTITIDASAGTFTRALGDYTSDGFVVGMSFEPSGYTNAGNLSVRKIKEVTPTVVTVIDSSGLVSELGDGDERLRGNRNKVKGVTNAALSTDSFFIPSRDIRFHFDVDGSLSQDDVNFSMWDVVGGNPLAAAAFGLETSTSNVFFQANSGYSLSLNYNSGTPAIAIADTSGEVTIHTNTILEGDLTTNNTIKSSDGTVALTLSDSTGNVTVGGDFVGTLDGTAATSTKSRIDQGNSGVFQPVLFGSGVSTSATIFADAAATGMRYKETDDEFSVAKITTNSINDKDPDFLHFHHAAQYMLSATYNVPTTAQTLVPFDTVVDSIDDAPYSLSTIGITEGEITINGATHPGRYRISCTVRAQDNSGVANQVNMSLFTGTGTGTVLNEGDNEPIPLIASGNSHGNFNVIKTITTSTVYHVKTNSTVSNYDVRVQGTQINIEYLGPVP